MCAHRLCCNGEGWGCMCGLAFLIMCGLAFLIMQAAKGQGLMIALPDLMPMLSNP